jgi:hypothetical protein
MSKFDEWWNSDENSARGLPETTAIQIKPFMRDAFNAGKEAWRKTPKDRTPAQGDMTAGHVG